MITCSMCGKCCYYKTEAGDYKKCQFLVKQKNGKTLCRVYQTRVGRVIYKKGTYMVRCILRENAKHNYPGCPFNKEEYDEKTF